MSRIIICLVSVLLLMSVAAEVQATTWQTIYYPNSHGTHVRGIGGGSVYGHGNNDVSFVRDQSGNFTTFSYPDISDITAFYKVDTLLTTVVGSYRNATTNQWHGMTYNWSGGGQWSTITCSLASGDTYLNLYGISDTFKNGDIVPRYTGAFSPEGTSFQAQGVYFDGTDWCYAHPSDSYTSVLKGISGNKAVGWYQTTNGVTHGYVYDTTTGVSTTLDYPGAGVTSTCVEGIAGNMIVGWYNDDISSHGFFYDGTKFTSFDVPGSHYTAAYDIALGSGGNYQIVGEYMADATVNGFIYTIPEPATLGLLAMGGLAIIRRRRK